MVAAHQAHTHLSMTYEGDGCKHIVARNSTHCLILTQTGERAVEEWLAALAFIYASVPDYAIIRILTDARLSDATPTHLIAQLSLFFSQQRTSHIRARIAFLNDGESVNRMATMLASVLSQDTGHDICFFTRDELTNAVRWLA